MMMKNKSLLIKLFDISEVNKSLCWYTLGIANTLFIFASIIWGEIVYQPLVAAGIVILLLLLIEIAINAFMIATDECN